MASAWDIEITDGGWDGVVVAEAELTPNTCIPDVVVDGFVRVPGRPTPAGEDTAVLLVVVEFEVGSDVRVDIAVRQDGDVGVGGLDQTRIRRVAASATSATVAALEDALGLDHFC